MGILLKTTGMTPLLVGWVKCHSIERRGGEKDNWQSLFPIFPESSHSASFLKVVVTVSLSPFRSFRQSADSSNFLGLIASPSAGSGNPASSRPWFNRPHNGWIFWAHIVWVLKIGWEMFIGSPGHHLVAEFNWFKVFAFNEPRLTFDLAKGK